MISVEEARRRIENLGVDGMRELTKKRLLGVDLCSFGSAHSSEPCEDLIIQLLRDPSPEEGQRRGVVAGCADIYAKLLEWVASPDRDQTGSSWMDVAIRISRVVDVTAPIELVGHANSLLELVRAEGDKVPELLGAAVRACMGYKRDSMLPMWEGIIRTCREAAAYAFNAILKIDPGYYMIEEHLRRLWEKQVLDNWPVDTAFLMRRAARIRKQEALIGEVLSKVREEDWWGAVKEELGKRRWSREWLGRLPRKKEAKGREVHEIKADVKALQAKDAYAGLRIMSYFEGIVQGRYCQGVTTEYFDVSTQGRIRKRIQEIAEEKPVKETGFRKLSGETYNAA